jgi:L,D-peptidoglycan transpeptidase YkuD (ErfK/YbiS/YcfS/YnhG family)
MKTSHGVKLKTITVFFLNWCKENIFELLIKSIEFKRMRLFCFILLFLFVFVCNAGGTSVEQVSDKQVQKVVQTIKNNSNLPDSIRQLIVVFNHSPYDSSAILVALEKVNNIWNMVATPVIAGIGRNGFANPGEKREGDLKSPSGLFRLGQLFCYDNSVTTKMPFIQTTARDKWIDDPKSPDYNRHIRGETTAKSWENMKLKSNEYYYCMVIEYNFYPVVKGMGSAIFLHLSLGENPNSGAGCVIIRQKDMEWLLKWMTQESNPSILMGTEKMLMNGLKK